MNNNLTEIRDKIRQQFDTGPYPRTPLEASPKNDAKTLHIHNLVTAYYVRNQKVIETEGKLILDAGCGTGYKSLVLAAANPDAKIIGVDISDKSIELAKQRLQYHGFDNTEFYVISLEELPQLGLSFDYINCDEVLYLLPEPSVGLQAMKSVLKPDGIIRINLHSSFQRQPFYRAQEMFKLMGLMDGNPEELEVELVQDTFKALKDQVQTKITTWRSEFGTSEGKVDVLMNYLLQGDKGYTIPEMFSALRIADLEFINMVNWRQWDLMTLFKEPDNLPAFLAISLPETTAEEKLHLFELLNPIHRLLDFWCGHPQQGQSFVPVAEWTLSDWQEVRVHLHPQLRTPQVKAELIRCINQLRQFEISQYLSISGDRTHVETTTAACLFPLWEEAQPMKSLVERWLRLQPVNLITLEPTTEAEAWNVLIQSLTQLESLGYVLLKRQ